MFPARMKAEFSARSCHPDPEHARAIPEDGYVAQQTREPVIFSHEPHDALVRDDTNTGMPGFQLPVVVDPPAEPGPHLPDRVVASGLPTDPDAHYVKAHLRARKGIGHKAKQIAHGGLLEVHEHAFDDDQKIAIRVRLPHVPHPAPVEKGARDAAYSMSKTFTLYGMRCGAMICMAPNDEIADEFQRCCEFSCRASWSNPVRAAQSIIAKIFADPDLYDAVVAERAGIRDMLIRRGRAFDQAAKDCGLVTVPFSAGFFCSIPHGE